MRLKKNIAALLTPVDWVVLSALKRECLNELIEKIIALIPEGERLYPEEMIIDYPLTIQAAEIIREKVLMHTYQEIPHSVAVKIIKIIERSEKNLLEIYGEIYVEKDSQKKIIIGKAGSLIKKIGTQARQELEFITGRKIFLDLQVKVKEKWRDKESFIKAIYQSG
ncbi:MAG: GTPase Era [Candidatus Saccharicenans sp.]